jgi:hydrogenase expression/formation protein HypC
VPARLIELHEGGGGRVDLAGSELPVSCVLLPEAQVGDWLLVHAGFALRRLSEADAAEIWAQWTDLDLQLGGEHVQR